MENGYRLIDSDAHVIVSNQLICSRNTWSPGFARRFRLRGPNTLANRSHSASSSLFQGLTGRNTQCRSAVTR